MTIATDIQGIIMPVLPTTSDTKGMLSFVAGFAGGYFYLTPYMGGSSLLAGALVGWASARSAYKLWGMENLAYAFGAADKVLVGMVIPAVAPLAVMYGVSMYYPMVDPVSSLVVYGAYVLGAYATQKLIASWSSSAAHPTP